MPDKYGRYTKEELAAIDLRDGWLKERLTSELSPDAAKYLQDRGRINSLYKASPGDNPPATLFGLPDLRIYGDRSLLGQNSNGYVLENGFTGRGGINEEMFVKPVDGWSNTTKVRPHTIAHEAEHLLARRGTGGANLNPEFDQRAENAWDRRSKITTEKRKQFVEAMVDLGPYMEKKYGSSSGYFDKDTIKEMFTSTQGALYEQLAELSAIEHMHKVDLTKDPELRKTVFKDKEIREIFRSLVGLRQTRLDAKDLAPYSVYDEKTGRNKTYDQVKAVQDKYDKAWFGTSPVNAAAYKGRYEIVDPFESTIGDTTK